MSSSLILSLSGLTLAFLLYIFISFFQRRADIKKLALLFEDMKKELTHALHEKNTESLHHMDKNFAENHIKLLQYLDDIKDKTLSNTSHVISNMSAKISSLLVEGQKQQNTALHNILNHLNETIQNLNKNQNDSLQKLETQVYTQLTDIKKDNENKLEKIRLTVEKKLQETLENKISANFKTVSEQLEQVYKGLGEMRTLAKGVGDLKQVLSNVKLRGNFGETQLSSILSDVMSPEQFEANCKIAPHLDERVDFAIKLPGSERMSQIVYLPIDAKFPQEDFIKLQNAQFSNDSVNIELAQKSLKQRILEEAQKIKNKYIAPPHSTDFAILFLATESLYAETLKIPNLWDKLQKLKVIPCGPTNLVALLNSLQMGFKTLAIQKRSHEVWMTLGAVKTEFEKFGQSLEAVNKKIQEASFKMDETTRRTRVLTRKLKSVESLPESQAELILKDDEHKNGINYLKDELY